MEWEDTFGMRQSSNQFLISLVLPLVTCEHLKLLPAADLLLPLYSSSHFAAIRWKISLLDKFAIQISGSSLKHSKVTCVHAWNLFSFAEHLKWSLICSQPENPSPQLNVDLMAALLNLKSSATLNKQICHIEVIAARYCKPRVPCQIVKGSTVEQRFMGH